MKPHEANKVTYSLYLLAQKNDYDYTTKKIDYEIFSLGSSLRSTTW